MLQTEAVYWQTRQLLGKLMLLGPNIAWPSAHGVCNPCVLQWTI